MDSLNTAKFSIRPRPVSLGSVLIVDDEPTMLKVMQKILIDEGYETYTALEAYSAFKILARESVDVVVTNIKMYPMDGLTMSNLIKLEFPGPEIVICSAYASRDTMQRARQIGVRDYITKPFKVDKLLRTIRLAAVWGPNNREAYLSAILEGKDDEFLESRKGRVERDYE